MLCFERTAKFPSIRKLGYFGAADFVLLKHVFVTTEFAAVLSLSLSLSLSHLLFLTHTVTNAHTRARACLQRERERERERERALPLLAKILSVLSGLYLIDVNFVPVLLQAEETCISLPFSISDETRISLSFSISDETRISLPFSISDVVLCSVTLNN